jgi:Na+-translocating ferredoxin:NAD+ oxidoreductase subunit D
LVTAVLTEILFKKLMHKKPQLHDWSALLTGLFVALLFQATTPWYKAALATFIAVGIAKELAGGLGWNRFNPAFSAVLLWLYWLRCMPMLTSGSNHCHTPWASGHDYPGNAPGYVTGRSGNAAGQRALLCFSCRCFIRGFTFCTSYLGAAYLFYRKHIGWRIPVSILATMIILTMVTGENPIYHLVTGGIMIGAFFMATDWVTSPMTDKGKIIYGVAIGALVVVFRVGFMITEGVAFAILIMNAFVPMIEKATSRPQFGKIKAVAVPMAERK